MVLLCNCWQNYFRCGLNWNALWATACGRLSVFWRRYGFVTWYTCEVFLRHALVLEILLYIIWSIFWIWILFPCVGKLTEILKPSLKTKRVKFPSYVVWVETRWTVTCWIEVLHQNSDGSGLECSGDLKYLLETKASLLVVLYLITLTCWSWSWSQYWCIVLLPEMQERQVELIYSKWAWSGLSSTWSKWENKCC